MKDIQMLTDELVKLTMHASGISFTPQDLELAISIEAPELNEL